MISPPPQLSHCAFSKLATRSNFTAQPNNTILSLAVVLAACAVVVTPGQPLGLVGPELLALALACWLGLSLLQRNTYRKTGPPFRRRYWLHIALGQVAMLACLTPGAAVLLGGEAGLRWLLPGALLSYLVALTESWVLLVEIKR